MAPNTETRIVRKRVQPDTKDVGFIESDGQELLRVPVSSTNEDRDGDVFSKEGLEKQLEQLETGTVKMFPDHGLDADGHPVYRFSDIMGKWVGGEIEGDTLFGYAELRKGDSNAEELRDLVEQDMPVGFSVGFGVPEGAANETENGLEFSDADLMEVSAVGIESNPDAVVGASLAKAFKDAGVEPTESLVADLTDAIKSMTEEKDEPTDEVEQTEEQSKEGDKDDEEYEDKEPNAKFSDDEVSEIMGVVGGVVESHMEALTNDIRENLMDADSEENAADTEESEGSDGDDEDEEMSADVKALVDTVEDQKETIEELRAKVDSIESKSRESAGKKGMVPAEKDTETEATETKAKEAPEDFYANLA